jgi:hypothetical protein
MPSREWIIRDSDSVGQSIPSPATREAISIVTRAADSHCTHPMLITCSRNHDREKSKGTGWEVALWGQAVWCSRISFTCDTRHNRVCKMIRYGLKDLSQRPIVAVAESKCAFQFS